VRREEPREVGRAYPDSVDDPDMRQRCTLAQLVGRRRRDAELLADLGDREQPPTLRSFDVSAALAPALV
jgi:hypothetical protein